MSKKDTMAKLLGLFPRDGVWYIRVLVPKDLQDHFGNDSGKVVKSLKTRDYSEAKARATMFRAEMVAAFDQKRRELAPPKTVERITP